MAATLSENQRTIAQPAGVEGLGLFMGEKAAVRFRPAPANHGVVFVRMDMTEGGEPVRIPALVTNVTKRARRTTLRRGAVSIDTCEHILSAVAGLQIDNVLIEVQGPEIPGVDGSSRPFVEALQSAGMVEQEAARRTLTITDAVTCQDGDAMIAALPADKPHMQVIYDLDYGDVQPIGKQLYAFNSDNGDYIHNIAPARTYVLEAEAVALRQAGMGKHLSADDLLVLAPTGPMGTNRFRFADECVRHKILDLIGDLSLCGCAIRGRIVAYKSGHALNHQLARKLLKMMQGSHRTSLLSSDGLIDVRKIMRILPHRYPMLLVDRVLEIEGDRKAIGVKNVSINEQFMQGHYPGTPIMPGVLIVEALAQLSGVLLANKLEHTGRLAVLLSIDKVKLRRPVTPGDQLILEAETVRIRSRTGHTRCKAYVGSHLAAEAEIKFMLVDAEPE